MDLEVARTLDELERKILDLERTLGTLTSAYPPASAPAPSAGSEAAEPPRTAVPPAAPTAEPPRAALPPAPQTAGPQLTPASSQPALAGGWSRIVDEAVERTRTRERRAPRPGAAVHY